MQHEPGGILAVGQYTTAKQVAIQREQLFIGLVNLHLLVVDICDNSAVLHLLLCRDKLLGTAVFTSICDARERD